MSFTVEEILKHQEEMAYAFFVGSMKEMFKQIEHPDAADFGEGNDLASRGEGAATAVVMGRLYIEGNATPATETVEVRVRALLEAFSERFSKEIV